MMKMRDLMKLVEGVNELMEISAIPSHHFGEEQIQDGIRRAARTKRKLLAQLDTPNGVVRISWGEPNPKTLDVIFSQNKTAYGFALLENNEIESGDNWIDGWYVTEIGLMYEIRGDKIGYQFYKILLDRGMTLFSGTQQTPDSQKIWRRLMQDPSVKVVVATADGQYDPKEIDAWSAHEHTLVATRTI